MSKPETSAPTSSKRRLYDFFISFNKADAANAQLIRNWLNDAGYSTFMQHPDFHAGSNFVLKMDEAVKTCRRVVAVLSTEYLESEFTQPEWAAFFAKDPRGQKGLIVAARITPCTIDGLLANIRYIDLIKFSSNEWRDELLKEIENLPSLKGTRSVRKATNAPPTPSLSAIPTPVAINVGHNSGNIAGRDLTVHNYTKPPKPKVVLERRETWVSDSQAAELKSRMKDYAEFRFTVNKGKLTMGQAFQYSWADFNRDHDIPRYDALPAERFEESLDWFRKQKGILTRKLRKLDRPGWRNARIGSIKRAMKTMGYENANYYPEVARRLKMKKEFASLTDVTDRDLQRIYTMALRDAGVNEN